MHAVLIVRSAEKALLELPRKAQERILERMVLLGDNPRPLQAKKLKASDEYRLRVGEYRVLYKIDDKEKKVTVGRIERKSDTTYTRPKFSGE